MLTVFVTYHYFLGLRTLDIITDTLRAIQKKTGQVIDPLKDIPMDDADVYREIFQKGRTNSVFQFESDGMKQMLKRFKPDRFEDLIILVSMFRPGPIQFIDGVIDVKQGRKEVQYVTPEVEPILGKTYGGIVYQEQVMEIFQKLAGYTLGQADNVRRYMSKKKMDKLAHEQEAFIYGDPQRNIKGCVANGISVNAAKELFAQMTEFAKYAFNKSHAAAYAANSYYTAWLKYHYPSEFIAAALNWTNLDKISGLIYDARDTGIKILVPNINFSDENFLVTPDGSVRYGLSAVKGVGEEAKKIIAERKENGKFDSFYDFFVRCNVNRKAIENLIYAGAFDDFEYNRSAMIQAIDSYKDIQGKIQTKQNQLACYRAMLPYIDYISNVDELIEKQAELGVKKELNKMTTHEGLEKKIATTEESLLNLETQMSGIVIPTDVVENKEERMAKERECLGTYVTANPVDHYVCPSNIKVVPIAEINPRTEQIMGVIAVLNEKKRGSDGRPYGNLVIEDRSGSVKANIYTSAYAACKAMLHEGSVLIFHGYVRVEEEDGAADENGNNDSVAVKTFIVTNVSPAIKARGTLIWAMSEQKFLAVKAKLKSFEDKYKDVSGDGYPMMIQYNDVNGNTLIYDVPFPVSASIRTAVPSIRLV